MLCLPPGKYLLEIPLGIIELNAGKYSFVVSIWDAIISTLARVEDLRAYMVFSDRTQWGKIVGPLYRNSESFQKSIGTFG